MKKNFLFLLLFINISYSQCWKAIATSNAHVIAIKDDGTLWAWGDNSFGKLGDGGTTASNLPIQIGTASDWKDVSAGYHSSYAIKENGTIWAWGSNYQGQLGFGYGGYGMTTRTPTQIGIASDWKSISAGLWFVLALKQDGSLWAWGTNEWGALGNGTTTTNPAVHYAPGRIGNDSDWKAISGGYSHAMAIKQNGTLWVWGTNQYNCFGDGTGTNSYIPRQTGIGYTWNYVDAEVNSTTAIRSDLTYSSWGVDQNFKLAYPLRGETIKSVSGSEGHTAIVKTDGTLYTAGGNNSGQLGYPGTSSSGLQVGTDNHWEKVFTTGNNTFGLKTDGSLWSWGWSICLGDNSTINRDFPVMITTCPTLSVHELEFTDLSVFPNPGITNIAIRFPSGNDTIEGYIISDITGKTVLSGAEKTSTINVETLESGVYILKLFIDNGFTTRKFIKR